MKYCMPIRQTRRGIWVPRRLLHSLNVRDKSVCYTIKSEYRYLAVEYENLPTQLIISPIPHKTWGCSCRLTVRIKHEPGTLQRLLDILVDEGINVLFSQTVPAGLSHASVDIWGEVQDMRGVANEIQGQVERTSKADYEQMTRSYADAMHQKLAKLERRILEEGAPILHDSAVFAGDVFRGDTDLGPTGENIYRRFELKQVITRWVRNLAINYFYGVQRQARKLVYMSKIGALVPAAKIDRELFEEEPKLHIASFDPSNAYIRLRPFPSSDVCEHQFEYELTTDSSLPHLGELGSRGFLRDLLAFESHGESFEYVKSRSQRDNKHSEKGTITLAGRSSPADDPDLVGLTEIIVEANSKRIENQTGIKPSDGEIRLDFSHTSRRVSPFRVFFSLHRDTHEFFIRNAGKKYIQKIEDRTGVELLVAQAASEASVSNHVRQMMASAHGFLQILSLTFKEQNATIADTGRPFEFADLTWLTAEWMLATYRELPCSRLIDTSFKDENYWKEIVHLDRDSQLIECKVFLDYKDCIKLIENQIHDLVDRIHH